MLVLISWSLAMLDMQSLTHGFRILQARETMRQAEQTIQSVDRTLQRIVESRKRSEVFDQELRKQHDEINALLRNLGVPLLDPLPPKATIPPG